MAAGRGGGVELGAGAGEGAATAAMAAAAVALADCAAADCAQRGPACRRAGPPTNQLGGDEDILHGGSPSDGHVPRNIRLLLVAARLRQRDFLSFPPKHALLPISMAAESDCALNSARVLPPPD